MARKRAGPGGTGLPGSASGNRTDRMAVATPTGLPYGEAGQLQQAQQQVPIAAAAPTPPAAGASPGPPPTPGVPGGTNPPAVPNRPAPIPPGAAGDIHRPTERPTEPLTAGSPAGAGPGPEAILQGAASPANTNLSTMLTQMAQQSGSAAVMQLAQRAQMVGQ